MQTTRNIINDLSTIPSVKHSTFSQLFRTHEAHSHQAEDSFQRYPPLLYIHQALKRIYPSYFKFHMRWLHSVTRITYLSKLIGMPSLAACLKLELFRVYE
ncbi:hypothetical protein BV918_06410 [Pectobacterium odoriferum]|nr:hypothetical protein BV925_20995 [Pectobacterium odoriferum]POE18619.1 hypothetical protein BV918_06410 [Pectobacterium odoriferum]POE35488.1 hypothetical protein BV922_06395 [Pectobacterium odoriferum]